MKRVLDIVVTLCALVMAAVLWMSAGTQFMKMLTGPSELGEQDFAQAEGEYLLYEAAYPVGSYVEEYYSGDPDRVRRTGYVVYDEERQAFVYIVAGDNHEGELKSLMWNLHLAVELRKNKDMTPALVKGTLELMEQEEIEHVQTALQESEIVDLYRSFAGTQGDEAYYEAYFGDEYGRVMADMCQRLEQGWQQADWYVIEHGRVGGLAVYELWISALAAALNLLIFLFRLVKLFTGGKVKKSSQAIEPEAAGKAGKLLEAQRGWVEEWCEFILNQVRRMAYLTAAGGAVILVVIGVLVKTPIEGILALHLPLGLLLGEGAAAFLWLAQKGQSKPDKIIKKLKKSLERELPDQVERESFAQDILDAGKEWEFREKSKEAMHHGIVGSSYIVVFSWNGAVTAVDARRLARIETETVEGQIRSGKVRIHYVSYELRFYYRNISPKKSCDKALSFQAQGTQGRFVALVRKRFGDSIEITSAG